MAPPKKLNFAQKSEKKEALALADVHADILKMAAGITAVMKMNKPRAGQDDLWMPNLLSLRKRLRLHPNSKQVDFLHRLLSDIHLQAHAFIYYRVCS